MPDSGESGYVTLAAAHAISAVVAELAVAVADGDGTAVVAGWGVLLEGGELFAADGGAVFGDVRCPLSVVRCGVCHTGR